MSNFFQRMGLTRNEEQIYLFLLEYGHSIASLVGRRLGIKRVTTYAALRSLLVKGFVISFEKNGVKYFDAMSPKDIVGLCNKRVSEVRSLEKQAEQLLPMLQALHKKRVKPILEVRGEMKYYQGLDAVKELIDETLQEGGREQLCFGLNNYHIEHLEDEWKAYTKRRVAQGMHVQSIQPDTTAARAYRKRDTQEMRSTRLVPHKTFPAESELNIIGDMVALFVTHGDKPAGMKIYHTELAKLLRSLFMLAWEKADEYDKHCSAPE